MPVVSSVMLLIMLIAITGCGHSDGSEQASKVPGTVGTADAIALDALPSGSVRIEVPAKTVLAAHDTDTLSFGGWAFDDNHKAPCSAIEAVIDQRQIVAGKYGESRSDVANYFKNFSLNNVGYVVNLTPAMLPIGTHQVYIVCIDSLGFVGHRDPITYAITVAP